MNFKAHAFNFILIFVVTQWISCSKPQAKYQIHAGELLQFSKNVDFGNATLPTSFIEGCSLMLQNDSFYLWLYQSQKEVFIRLDAKDNPILLPVGDDEMDIFSSLGLPLGIHFLSKDSILIETEGGCALIDKNGNLTMKENNLIFPEPNRNFVYSMNTIKTRVLRKNNKILTSFAGDHPRNDARYECDFRPLALLNLDKFEIELLPFRNLDLGTVFNKYTKNYICNLEVTHIQYAFDEEGKLIIRYPNIGLVALLDDKFEVKEMVEHPSITEYLQTQRRANNEEAETIKADQLSFMRFNIMYSKQLKTWYSLAYTFYTDTAGETSIETYLEVFGNDFKDYQVIKVPVEKPLDVHYLSGEKFAVRLEDDKNHKFQIFNISKSL